MKTTSRQIPIDNVDAHPQQPRVEFDERKLDRLATSLSESVGLIHPITVRKKGTTRFELLSGERRLRAAQRAGWEKIDARIVEADDRAALLILLVANLEAERLNPLERARALANLAAPRAEGGAGMKYAEIAKQVGFKSEASVANSLRLLRLPDPWRSMVASGELQESKARCLVSYAEQPEILDAIRRDVETNAWAWRSRDDWERNVKIVAERVVTPPGDTPPQTAGKPLNRTHSAKAVGNTARRNGASRRPRKADIDALLKPYRDNPAALKAIRQAVENLLVELKAA